MFNQNQQTTMKLSISLGALATAGLLISVPVFAQAGTAPDTSTAPAVEKTMEKSPTSMEKSPASMEKSPTSMPADEKTTGQAPATAPAGESSTGQSSGSIVDVVGSNPNFSTLTAAVKAADLTETLSGKGPYTIFAPTDAAFAALPKGAVENLLKPENKEQLKQLLTYHVVSGSFKSTDLKPGASEVPTLLGKSVAVNVANGEVSINKSKVMQADVAASNGVIHVVDKVLLPAK
jgi:uncharacterized surface protein with fasciclin (FAS1) repeats